MGCFTPGPGRFETSHALVHGLGAIVLGNLSLAMVWVELTWGLGYVGRVCKHDDGGFFQYA